MLQVYSTCLYINKKVTRELEYKYSMTGKIDSLCFYYQKRLGDKIKLLGQKYLLKCNNFMTNIFIYSEIKWYIDGL